MGTIGLSENDYQEFLNWWNAGGGAGIGGRPANNDALWSNPKFIEWIFTQKFATLPWKKSLPNAPEIKQYLADAYENWSGTPAHIANLRLTYSHLPNVLTGAERVSALPGWSKYELNMIQTEGEDVGGYTLYKNQLYSTKGTTARPLTPEESNRILKKFYGEDTLARERFEFEKEQAAKGELATGRRTLWDIEQAAKTETRAAREAELSAAERAENRAWQREQTASTRAFQQAQLGVQERQQYAAMKARPSNWIQAWYYEHMPQLQSLPPIQRRAVEGMRLLSEQQPYLEPTGGRWAIPPQYAGFGGEPIPTTVGSYMANPEWLAIQQEYGPAIEAQQGQAAQAQATGYGSAPPRIPNAPPTPEFIATLTGGVPGEELQSRPLKVASAPYWQTMSPTQRAQLGGYQEWRGYPETALEDYQALVQSMLPKRSQQARWQPQRQWA